MNKIQISPRTALCAVLSIMLCGCNNQRQSKDRYQNIPEQIDSVDITEIREVIIGPRKLYIPLSWLVYSRQVDDNDITYIVPPLQSHEPQGQIHRLSPSHAGITLTIKYGIGDVKPVGVSNRSRVSKIRISGPIKFEDMGPLTQRFQIEDLQRVYGSESKKGWVLFQGKYYDVSNRHHEYLIDVPAVWAYASPSIHNGSFKTIDGIRVEYDFDPYKDSIPDQIENWSRIRRSVEEVVKWLSTPPEHRVLDPNFTIGGETYADNP